MNPEIETIAIMTHEVNKAWCERMGDHSQVNWAVAPDWQKESAIKGVEFKLANPDATPERMHQSWLEEKTVTGWKYGPVKDADKKEHPCFVPYGALPREQKVKDELFSAVVEILGKSYGLIP